MSTQKNAPVGPGDFAMFDDRAHKGSAVARALDEGATIPYSLTVRIHRFQDVLDSLTPKRAELLRLAQTGRRSIAELAAAAHRDPSAVSRDIAKLVALGLVQVLTDGTTGHGARKIVQPVSELSE